MPYDHEAMRATAEGLQGAVLAILEGHRGAGSAIKAGAIARRLDLSGRYADRPVREAIKELRRQGHLILSSVKQPYGYFLASSEREWLEFRDSNLKPRALDILETASAMGQAAQSRWGGTQQLRLDLVV
jgi:hypothetical protein